MEKFLERFTKARQTDGGGEFIKFKPYLTSQGIAHRQSCPYTSA